LTRFGRGPGDIRIRCRNADSQLTHYRQPASEVLVTIRGGHTYVTHAKGFGREDIAFSPSRKLRTVVLEEHRGLRGEGQRLVQKHGAVERVALNGLEACIANDAP